LHRATRGQGAHLVGSSGILQGNGTQIDVLAARRGQEIDHLERLLSAYQRSLASSPGGTATPQRTDELASQQTALPDQPADRRRASGPVRVSNAQFAALEAIARGGVMVRESSVVRGMFVTAPNRVRISRATVDALLGKELADRDTSTSLYQGQRLTLSAQGEAVLAEGNRQTSPRAEAARRRSTTTSVAAPDPGAAAPATATRPQPAHQSAPVPLDAAPDTGPADGFDDLLPLARRIAADSPRLTRDLLGTAIRSHGIRVSNRRVRALVDLLRAETVLGTAA
jgi:hypothetical protein